MSSGFARYDRTTHTLKLPNGYIYTFGHLADLGGDLGAVRYVTEIRDPFNNRIEFSYFASPGPVDGVSQIRQYLSATEVREVNFTYDGARNTLATMSYAGRTWTYQHDPHGGAGHSLLREVHAPLGPPEKYDYTALPGELTRYETPAGGVTTYSYQDAYRKASTLTNRTRVVTQRTVSGRLVTADTWTFAFGTGANEDTTVISCTCGMTTYRFNGVGLSGDFSAWKSGTLAEETVAEPNGTVLETRTFTWQRSEAISPDAVAGESGVWSDAAVYTALLQSSTITRGTQSWTTEYEYHTTNFNDFGQPWKVIESGQFTRTTETTFQGGFTPHIVGRPAGSSIRVGPETVTATWTYDLATGFVTSYVGPRSPLRSFVPRTDGNLASEKDALNHETTYENYFWGKPQIVQTPTMRMDFNYNTDGTINYFGSAVVVHYNYDDLFRQTKTWSNAVNPVFTHYNNTDGSGSWSERAAASAGVTQDGFGRPVLSSHSSAVKTYATYDACGRPVTTSMPYTSGLPHVIGTPGPGTTTTFDALGRLKTVTGPNGAITQYAYNGIDVSVTDAEGRVTSYDYSAAGGPGSARLVGVTDAASVTTTYGYDEMDNLVRVSGPGPVPDRTWTYNDLGLPLTETQPESGTTTYVYDAAGNLTSKTDAKGQVTLFTYDADNRLKTVNPPGTADDVTLTYDIHGRLQSQATATTGITYTYHPSGHLATRTDTVSGVANFVSSYTYDSNENLKTVTYPSGRVVTYDYDSHDRLITVKYGNDVVFADQFTYDGGGRLASYRTGTVTHTIGYDASGRTQTLSSGSALNLTYGYDLVGNVRSITDPMRPLQQFTYDTLDRLQIAAGQWGQTTYTYTPSGDRLTEGSPFATTSYQYDATTRRLMSTTGARTESFQYDSIGQMTADARGTYTYNAAGLVTQFTAPTVSAAYAYDPSGLRIAKTVNSVTTYTVRSAGGTVLSEYTGACGTPIWTRDVIHAGGRLLGSIKAVTTEPTVTLAAATGTVPESQATVTATVQLALPAGMATSPCAVTVSYEAQSGTATKLDDFTLTVGTVTFPAGSAAGATRTITVALLNDVYDEDDETFTVTLAGATGARLSGLNAQTFTVTDDDAAPTVSIQDVSAVEADSTNVTMTFTVSLSAVSGKTVTVNYAFADLTATAGADYASGTGSFSGTVTLDPGVLSQTLVVEVLPDLVDEPAETFDITLSNATNASFSDATARGTITDNDPTTISIGDVTVKAGKIASFTLTLSIPAEQTITVSFGTLDDTAIAGTDYSPTTGSVTFTVGSLTRTVNVATLADAPERDEVFKVSLYSPTGGAVVPGAPASATIVHRRKGDLNGDGHPDLLWQHTDGSLLAWLMNGVTMLATGGSSYLTPANAGAGWSVVGMADFNDDGYQDLLLQHTNGSL